MRLRNADPKFGHFSNDARLSDEERRQICAWVENGAAGGPGTCPSRVSSPQAGRWASRSIIYMRDQPYAVPAEGVVRTSSLRSILVGLRTSGFRPPS